MHACLQNAGARLQRHLEYSEVSAKNLRVMDATAVVLCEENDIPVVVFNMFVPGNIQRAVTGDPSVGTTIGRRCTEPQLAQQMHQRRSEERLVVQR